ncbi:MAG: glucosyltransferase domain-containing protein [Pseudomonadota bacterium]
MASSSQTPLWAYAALYGVVVAAYLFQAVAPVFNEDDITQVQNDALKAFLMQGRWGYAFVYSKLLANNPTPVTASLIGLGLLIWSGFLQARFIGLKTTGARIAFVLIASISIHYQFLFSFDSTRLAYMAANLFMVLGLLLGVFGGALSKRVVGGVFVLLAMSLYPAALMYGATTVLIGIIAWSMAPELGPLVAARRAGVALLVTVLALCGFSLATDVIYAAGGWSLGPRVALDFSGVFSRGPVIWELFGRFVVPFLTGDFERYFPIVYYVLVLVLIFVSLVVIGVPGVHARRYDALSVSGVAAALLTISPFCLAFVTMTGYYPARSLYAYATAYAGLAALALDHSLKTIDAPGSAGSNAPNLEPLRRLKAFVCLALGMTAALFVLFNMILISQRSYDEYLAWQSDRALVERIIARIDDVIADDAPDLFAPSRESAAAEAVPLAVFGVQHWRAGPRGEIQTVRLFPWSRERVFRLIDQRFRKVTDEERAAVRPSVQDRRPWPAREAVYLDKGIMVVVLSDERLDW